MLHAGGDATGAEIERALVAQLRAQTNVTILEHTVATDLVASESGACDGVIVQPGDGRVRTLVSARTTVLANGGAGQLWAVTTNPKGATGAGIAMAIRAGVAVADLEFTQFHPTVLTGSGYEPFLVSEAVRGEGAYLRSADGERFMLADHPLAELAPRDVVARSIQRRMIVDGGEPVVLDLRHLDPALVRKRFPTITERLADYGLDLTTDLIPVAPAAHYFMGGVVANTRGETSMPGLLALGEVSCTGIHGANRLASNSLLEGLVFGLRAADRINGSSSPLERRDAIPGRRASDVGNGAVLADARLKEIRRAVLEIMSANVAVVRSAATLEAARARLAALESSLPAQQTSRHAVEARNLLLLAREVTRSALAREESRGGHVREDFPNLRPDLDGRHQIVRKGTDGMERDFRALHEAWKVSRAW